MIMMFQEHIDLNEQDYVLINKDNKLIPAIYEQGKYLNEKKEEESIEGATILKVPPLVFNSLKFRQIEQVNSMRLSKCNEYADKMFAETNNLLLMNDEEFLCQFSAVISKHNKFEKSASTLKKELNENRIPITKTFDEIKKMFTNIESSVKKITDDSKSLKDRIGVKHNQITEAERVKEQKRIATEKEVVEIKIQFQYAYDRCLNNYISNSKNKLSAYFINDISLDNYKKRYNLLKTKIIIFNKDKAFEDFWFDLNQFKYHTTAEINLICEDIDVDMDLIEKKYIEEMQVYTQETLAKMPSKLAYLERIAKEKDEKEKARLKKAEENFKKEEDEKQAKAKDEAERKIKAEAELNKAIKQSEIDLKNQKTSVEIKSEKYYEIEVLNPYAYKLMFTLWFESEVISGNLNDNKKIENVSLGRIKSFCEKIAKENQIRHDSLIYNEKIKVK